MHSELKRERELQVIDGGSRTLSEQLDASNWLNEPNEGIKASIVLPRLVVCKKSSVKKEGISTQRMIDTTITQGRSTPGEQL